MSTLARASELYVSKRTLTALRLAASANLGGVEEIADAMAERFIVERLSLDYPGIFDVVDQCGQAYDEARKANKALTDEWTANLPKKPI